MSATILNRFTCNGCGKVTDCTNDDLRGVRGDNSEFSRSSGDRVHENFDSPFGWVKIHVSAGDPWRGKRATLVETSLGIGHACSLECAVKAIADFATSLPDRLAR
jgi:hypothetical protein